MKPSLSLVLLPLLAAGSLEAATVAYVFGINFNNNDAAGAQEGSSTFGAEWTDLNSGPSGAERIVNGTGDLVNVDWASANFWSAGSWTGADGFNAAIGTMRVYGDDGDNPAAGFPGDLGAVNGDGIGVAVRLQGMADWMDAASVTSYRVTIYSSTDTAAALFQSATIRDGGTVTSTALETLGIPALGNGQWDGTQEDPLGNLTGGTRGNATFTGEFSAGEITITVPSRSGSTRGTVAAIVITAVPEPSVSLISLGAVGLLALRRRR